MTKCWLRSLMLFCLPAIGAGTLFAQTAPPPSAPSPQSSPPPQSFQARIDEVARSFENNPRFKGLSQQQRLDRVEFVIGNTLFFSLCVGLCAALRAFPAEPGRPHVRPLIRIEPIEVDRTNPVVRALEMAVRAEGGRPTLWRKSGTSDLNLVAPAWQVAGAAYGPGDPHLDHTSHEWVAERELARSARVLRAAIGQLSQEFSTPSASAAHSP